MTAGPAAALLVALAAAPVLPGAALADPDAGICASAGSDSAPHSVARIGSQGECLVNHARALRRLSPLRASPRLARSARAHARDMLRRRYFSHTAPGGETLAARIARTGYLRRARSWVVGEDLGWLSLRPFAAHAMTRMWMGSPGHRAVILDRRFRDMGIAVFRGAPTYQGPALTFVLHVGGRW